MGGDCTGRDCQEVHEGPSLEGSSHHCPLSSWHPLLRLLPSWVAASDLADLQMASTLCKQPEPLQFAICSILPLPSEDMGGFLATFPHCAGRLGPNWASPSDAIMLPPGATLHVASPWGPHSGQPGPLCWGFPKPG